MNFFENSDGDKWSEAEWKENENVKNKFRRNK